MGFLDSVSNTFNKTVSAADRGTKTMKLKGQINDINKQREKLAAQLGALLFEKAKDLPELRELCGTLFDDISGLDAQRTALQEKIAAIEAEAAVAAATYTTYVCPTCGRKVTGTDKFCAGCGTPIDVIKANQPQKPAPAAAAPVVAPGTPVCAVCGAPLGPG
ncbi:MAG: zinc-ribbon domain-containing protein, partial [Coriobacteriales bacterium]|nr:zinc-ribbon domain-containing protein [Coriobacteriales bacterium]